MIEAAVMCLALNAYHEARNEGFLGMVAVSQVVMERVRSGDRRWPRDVCQAVKQGGPLPLHRCQFSWYCDGKSDRPRELKAWADALYVARVVLDGKLKIRSLEGATCYHAVSMQAPPQWAYRVQPVGAFLGHAFYKC